MKRTILLLGVLVSGAASAAFAQVVPAATRGGISLTAGALGSVFQPDCFNGFTTSCPATAPTREYGVGGYVDVHFSRWVQLEGEARFLRINTSIDGIHEDTYLVGPRVPLHTFHFMHATPYAKVLVGLGDGNFLSSPAFTVAFGGGLDLRLTKKISLRAGDFEYQRWRVTTFQGGQTVSTPLWPYGVSVGVGYKVF